MRIHMYHGLSLTKQRLEQVLKHFQELEELFEKRYEYTADYPVLFVTPDMKFCAQEIIGPEKTIPLRILYYPNYEDFWFVSGSRLNEVLEPNYKKRNGR